MAFTKREQKVYIYSMQLGKLTTYILIIIKKEVLKMGQKQSKVPIEEPTPKNEVNKAETEEEIENCGLVESVHSWHATCAHLVYIMKDLYRNTTCESKISNTKED